MLPARFDQIRGHRLQVEALVRMANSGRWGHAWLFEGSEGVGKQTVARALLGRLACLAPTAGDACGQCRSCLALQRGDHPDLKVLERDGASIKIDQIRDATSRLRFEPIVGRIKAILIEGAETLREEAANALLKTLEEPPPATVFVLVTAKPQLLLPTIRSRCQVLRFGDLPVAELAALLQATGIDRESAWMAAALADGSLTRARDLCDPEKLSVIDFIASFTFGFATRTPAQAGAFTQELAGHLAGEGGNAARADFGREELLLAMDALRAALRDVMLVACGTDPATLPHARHAAAMRAMAARVDANQIAKALQACEEIEQRLSLNLSARLAWTNLMVEVSELLTA